MLPQMPQAKFVAPICVDFVAPVGEFDGRAHRRQAATEAVSQDSARIAAVAEAIRILDRTIRSGIREPLGADAPGEWGDEIPLQK